MTGKEILIAHQNKTGTLKTTFVDRLVLAQQIDAALQAEREACAEKDKRIAELEADVRALEAIVRETIGYVEHRHHATSVEGMKEFECTCPYCLEINDTLDRCEIALTRPTVRKVVEGA